MNPRQAFFGTLLLFMAVASLDLLTGWLHHDPQVVTPVIGNPMQQFQVDQTELAVVNAQLHDPTTPVSQLRQLHHKRDVLQKHMHQMVQNIPIEQYTDDMRPYLNTPTNE